MTGHSTVKLLHSQLSTQRQLHTPTAVADIPKVADNHSSGRHPQQWQTFRGISEAHRRL